MCGGQLHASGVERLEPRRFDTDAVGADARKIERKLTGLAGGFFCVPAVPLIEKSNGSPGHDGPGRAGGNSVVTE